MIQLDWYIPNLENLKTYPIALTVNQKPQLRKGILRKKKYPVVGIFGDENGKSV